VVFKTKPQIALALVDRAKANGIQVDAWTADELYGRSSQFLDGLDERGEAFAVEIPPDAHIWLAKPKVLRKTKGSKLVSNQCTLIVTRNVLTDEVKYFLSNRVPGRNGWTLRRILRVAFGRWAVEGCFREAKEELGLDHFECRGWRCIHRHLYTPLLSQLFCAQARQRLSPSEDVLSGDLLTIEQVRRATDVVIETMDLNRRDRDRKLSAEVARQNYYARRNATAAKSHEKTRRKRLAALGIAPDQIKSIEVSRPNE